jgi:uncharacterized protein YegP (UPF0339 family)
MKIEIIKTGWFRQKWYFRVRASNGELVIPVEHYTNLDDLKDTIALLQTQLPTAEIVTIVKEKK